MHKNERVSASLEDYLEAIFNIVEKKQAARAKDIVEKLKVKASSVTGALRLLSEKGLVNYVPYDLITLTPEGKKLAADVVKRHKVLHHFFKNVLGIDDKEAGEAACKLEHVISKSILDRLIIFSKFLERCPETKKTWEEELKVFCARKKR